MGDVAAAGMDPCRSAMLLLIVEPRSSQNCRSLGLGGFQIQHNYSESNRHNNKYEANEIEIVKLCRLYTEVA